jgi:hypothetical protein
MNLSTSITETNPLILFREIPTVYLFVHTKHMNKLHSVNAYFPNVIAYGTYSLNSALKSSEALCSDTSDNAPQYSLLRGQNRTPWSESASELYRPSDRRLSAKLMSTFADREVSRSQRDGSPYGRNLGFLDLCRYFLLQVLSTHLRLGLPSGLFPSGFPTNNL